MTPTTIPSEPIEHAGPPKKEAVLARAAAEAAGWRRRLPAAGPRLFFDADAWKSLPGRYAAATGLQRKYFDAVLARAGAIVARPTPAYRTPAEVVKAEKMTPLDAAQELWQRPVGNGMVALALALAIQGDPAVRTKLRDMILTACSYPQWGGPGPHANQDLAAGHVARGIIVALDWHPDLMDACERAGVVATLRPRVNALVAAAYGAHFWAGHYDENHDHVSVCAVGLCGVALLDEVPEATEWTALALSNFERVAAESSPDGTSPEGVPYWSYGMSYTLQYVEGVRAVLGTGRLYDAPYFRNSIAARVHASTPGFAGIAPWGDAPPRDYYGPHHILYRLASEYRDGGGQSVADRLPFRPPEPDDAAWTALWYDPTVAAKPPADLDYHADAAGLVSSRSGWGDDDYLLCLKAGFTNRNHSHLDAGALALCVGSEWLLRTPGYGHGKGEGAFWDAKAGRWTYFSNSTESHTALLIDGRNQRYDREARGRVDAFVSEKDWLWTGADLTGAYAGVRRVRRDVLHCRGRYVLVVDRVDAPAAVTAEWLAQVPPKSVVTPAGLRATGKACRLDVRPLFPSGATFSARKPTSPHVDVDPSHMSTYALRQTGTALRFATLLVPGPAAESAGGVTAATPDGSAFTISGPDGEDRVVVSPHGDGPSRVTVVRKTGAGGRTVFEAGPAA